jgi:signal peptidase I
MEEPVTAQHGDAGILESGEAQPSRRERIQAVLREAVETLILAAIIYAMVNLTTARRVVQGPSMLPTLETGQFLLVSRVAYHLGEPQRGDIIVFHPPLLITEDVVKRIIGMPGETVSIEAGQVYIDGQLLEEPYITMPARGSGSWEVPEGHYFVMGDNRNNSQDSRSWEALARERIIGPAWLSYWPPNQWGVIAHYHDYDIEAVEP